VLSNAYVNEYKQAAKNTVVFVLMCKHLSV